MRKRFDQVAEGNGDDATHRTDADLPVRTRRFLHMRDVTVGSSAETSLLFWRGSSMTYQLVARAALSSDQRPGAARSGRPEPLGADVPVQVSGGLSACSDCGDSRCRGTGTKA